ncbi:MAG: hypothetical protein WA156_19850 [Methylocystis silviterrae]
MVASNEAPQPQESAGASPIEAELRDTRERLQGTIEEYETALEELKSANEETYFTQRGAADRQSGIAGLDGGQTLSYGLSGSAAYEFGETGFSGTFIIPLKQSRNSVKDHGEFKDSGKARPHCRG